MHVAPPGLQIKKVSVLDDSALTLPSNDVILLISWSYISCEGHQGGECLTSVFSFNPPQSNFETTWAGEVQNCLENAIQ